MNTRIAVANRTKETGVSLIVSLLMLIVVSLLGISAARIALQGEKVSRNDRDRQIALQAAEAALMDAELDIEGSPDAAKSRSALFASDNMLAFPATGCKAGVANIDVGLCSAAAEGSAPVWQTVDFLDASENASSVPYGRFTGYSFPAGMGTLPARQPRYVIEPMMFAYKGYAAEKPEVFYRITAIGFGMRDSTQVVLQTFYKKADK
ncbi:pilus assembly PilX family protein [Noviherbaspirillum saxi]|uniref:Pilus assembly protein n=1 Tax=Noviherbaspirillum saxi TaxID=2320863 RepID=A0A3A3GGQ2_9BURK|nr:PilX N-terminal domain-containing pilus assembly protein [Noviherbaspirillum saxi]RJG00080.1 pilus assembly protein [Noviherbaspirillum saxi]